MPEFINNNTLLVVSLDELVPDFWNSYDSLKKAIQRDEKKGYGLKKVARGGNGSMLLIDFDSLPDLVKHALGDPRKGMHILEYYYKADVQAVEFFKQVGNGYRNEEKLTRDVTNASLFNACKGLLHDREIEITNKGGRFKKKWETLCNDVITFTPILKTKFESFHNLPTNHRSFKIKYEKYLSEGYESLVHRGANNKNRLKVTENTYDLLRAIFRGRTHIKPSFKDVSDYYTSFLHGKVDILKDNKTGELFDPSNFKEVKRSTIYKWLSSWDSIIGTDSKGAADRQKLITKHIPHHSFEKEIYAGSIISVDDRQPPFYYNKNKDRMWFYLGQDVASQAITTWVWGETKEGLIIDFYRQMVRNYHKWGMNLPYELECESALNSTFSKGLLKPSNMFVEVRVEKNRARGKYIEGGYNRNVRYNKDLEKGDAGWVGRPNALSESNQMGAEKIPVLDKDILIKRRLKDIENYNNMPHPLDDKISRWEYWLKNQHPDLIPTNWRGILPYIGYKSETSCNAGIIKFQGQEWLIGEGEEICTGEELIDVMRRIEGKKVTVYWLDDDNGDIIKAIVFVGNSYICEAISKPLSKRSVLESTEKHKRARHLMNKYVGTIQAYQNKRKNDIEPVIILDNREVTLNKKFKIFYDTDDVVKEYEKPKVMPRIEEDTVPVSKEWSTDWKSNW